MPGRIPSNAWHTMSPNAGSLANAGVQGFGSQLLPRSGDGPTTTVVWNSVILQLIYVVWFFFVFVFFLSDIIYLGS